MDQRQSTTYTLRLPRVRGTRTIHCRQKIRTGSRSLESVSIIKRVLFRQRHIDDIIILLVFVSNSGVIFYGMAVGQLPFISSRVNEMSSGERRKRFVAEINKGLGAHQRRAIAFLPMDYRCMMNRLLATDSTKRITIKELIVDPWMTEKGRRIICTNPFQRLNTNVQVKVKSIYC